MSEKTEGTVPHTANICIGSTSEEHFFCVIFEKITRIYLHSQVHKKVQLIHILCVISLQYICVNFTPEEM